MHPFNVARQSGWGDAFPSAWPINVPFFRTDLGLDCYYDGTRWLTKNEYALPLHNNNTLDPSTANSSSGNSIAATDLTQGGMWITRLSFGTYVATTNNGTNFWTVQFKSQAPNATQHNIGSSFNTSADTNDQWTKHTVTVGAAVTSGDTVFNNGLTKTSTPGNLYLLTVVYYRLIVT